MSSGVMLVWRGNGQLLGAWIFSSWRDLFRPLLANAARVIAPSRDVLKRMRRYVPEACYIELPHPGLLHGPP